MKAITTNGGRTRFNPNIYSSGKVCLSILGTWRGEPGEEWSSAQGLESILLSIQSLMSSNPYENEPGYEHANSKDDKKQQADYVAKVMLSPCLDIFQHVDCNMQIRHETLRIAVIERMEEYLGIHEDGSIDELPPLETEIKLRDEFDLQPDEADLAFEPFKDLCKRRFLWYYDAYNQAIEQSEKEVKPNQVFASMPFEGASNGMGGKFNYPELQRRMTTIMQALKRETAHWAKEGIVKKRQETSFAAFLEREMQHIAEQYRKDDNVTLNIELEDQNPFVWILTLFGRPMTQLDGGMFVMKLSISPRFPEEQPRVFFETSMFHHRISKHGLLCYFPKQPDEIKSHVQAIIEAVEDTDAPYDPRTLVHPEASRLYWGKAEEKKQYNRQLRRAVQRSMDG